MPRGPIKFTYPSGSRPLAGFTIKRGIGRGGFGEVYYAESDGGKEVALKLIRRNLDVEIRGVGHCLNLKHPHLVGLYDLRQDEQGDTWVVMEFVSGRSLEELLAGHPQGLPLADVLYWMHAIGAGVAYLHDKGIVHRDLKPGNIFSDEGLVKIGDYGLSKFISASRRSGQTESVGTVHYMAPEVANGRYGKEIDLYALGIILYEMLTGHVPFEGESVGEVLMKHLTAQPDLSALAEPYRSVVGRALDKDPEQRYSSVQEMLSALPPSSQPPLLLAQMSARPAEPGTIPPAAAPFAAAPLAAAPLAAARGGAAQAGQVAAAPLAATPLAAAAAAEEPVWRAVRTACNQALDGLRHSQLSTPVKLLLLAGAMYLLIVYAPFWIGLAVLAAMTYGGYRVVRYLWIQDALRAQQATESRPMAQAIAGGAQVAPGPVPAELVSEQLFKATTPAPAKVVAALAASPARRNWQRRPEAAVPATVLKTPREKSTELLGSFLIASLVSALMCVGLDLLVLDDPQWNQMVWLGLVGTVGAWGVLIPSKYWEGRPGEPLLRRAVLLGVGLGVGLFAYLADRWLLVDLPWTMDGSRLAGLEGYQAKLFEVDGTPNLKGYLAYFGLLLPALRWWQQADPLRSARLSIWSTVCVVFAAWLLNAFWPFPQPWGVLAAATMALSLQLASPWVPLDRRRNPLVA